MKKVYVCPICETESRIINHDTGLRSCDKGHTCTVSFWQNDDGSIIVDDSLFVAHKFGHPYRVHVDTVAKVGRYTIYFSYYPNYRFIGSTKVGIWIGADCEYIVANTDDNNVIEKAVRFLKSIGRVDGKRFETTLTYSHCKIVKRPNVRERFLYYIVGNRIMKFNGKRFEPLDISVKCPNCGETRAIVPTHGIAFELDEIEFRCSCGAIISLNGESRNVVCDECGHHIEHSIVSDLGGVVICPICQNVVFTKKMFVTKNWDRFELHEDCVIVEKFGQRKRFDIEHEFVSDIVEYLRQNIIDAMVNKKVEIRDDWIVDRENRIWIRR